jgi:uncharacterized protein involved in tolerance to divalent cations
MQESHKCVPKLLNQRRLIYFYDNKIKQGKEMKLFVKLINFNPDHISQF